MAETKEWYCSKVIWANIITFIIAVLALIGQLSFLTPKVVEVILLFSAILNGVLRIWFTGTQVNLPLGLGNK
jgi:uncharacterized integral membrane protein